MTGPQAPRDRFWPLGASAILAVVLLASAAEAARLCMLPALFPFDEEDERRERLERIVARHFEAQSITIVTSAEVAPLLEEVDERSGAIFEPATGRIDAARYEIYQSDVERSIREKLGCSGFLQMSLHHVPAWYDGTTASWDGQSTRINSGARIATRIFFSILVGATITEQGWVPALSLGIRVADLRLKDVAFRTAGVEPLMDFSYSRSRDLLPEDRWLRDEEILEEAVSSALGQDLSALKAETISTQAPGETSFRWE